MQVVQQLEIQVSCLSSNKEQEHTSVQSWNRAIWNVIFLFAVLLSLNRPVQTEKAWKSCEEEEGRAVVCVTLPDEQVLQNSTKPRNKGILRPYNQSHYGGFNWIKRVLYFIYLFSFSFSFQLIASASLSRSAVLINCTLHLKKAQKEGTIFSRWSVTLLRSHAG